MSDHIEEIRTRINQKIDLIGRKDPERALHLRKSLAKVDRQCKNSLRKWTHIRAPLYVKVYQQIEFNLNRGIE